MDLAAYLTEGKDPTHASGMNAAFQQALLAMFSAAPPDIQQGLRIFSGYRSPERQAQLFDAAVKKYGSVQAARKWVAPPGNSQHNHGMAADLKYASPAARAWAHQNAAKFGLRFPMGHEPWHIELSGARGGGGNGPGKGSPMAPSATQGPSDPATGRTIMPPLPGAAGMVADTNMGGLLAALGGMGGGGGAPIDAAAGADVQESGPLAASGMANQGVMDLRSLKDHLLPVPDQVSTSLEPMKLTAAQPGGSQGPFSQEFEPFRSRPGVAPLVGGIRLRA